MTDIPEDIMREARELLDGYAEDAVMAAARAILAERERCAQIASHASDMSASIHRDPGMRGSCRATADWIATAIRSPERAGE